MNYRELPIIISKKDLVKMISLSISTIRRLELEGNFPKRRKISDYKVGYLIEEVEEWVKTRKKVA